MNLRTAKLVFGNLLINLPNSSTLILRSGITENNNDDNQVPGEIGHEYIDNILQITYVIWFQAQPCDQDLRLAANA